MKGQTQQSYFTSRCSGGTVIRVGFLQLCPCYSSPESFDIFRNTLEYLQHAQLAGCVCGREPSRRCQTGSWYSNTSCEQTLLMCSWCFQSLRSLFRDSLDCPGLLYGWFIKDSACRHQWMTSQQDPMHCVFTKVRASPSRLLRNMTSKQHKPQISTVWFAFNGWQMLISWGHPRSAWLCCFVAVVQSSSSASLQETEGQKPSSCPSGLFLAQEYLFPPALLVFHSASCSLIFSHWNPWVSSISFNERRLNKPKSLFREQPSGRGAFYVSCPLSFRESLKVWIVTSLK